MSKDMSKLLIIDREMIILLLKMATKEENINNPTIGTSHIKEEKVAILSNLKVVVIKEGLITINRDHRIHNSINKIQITMIPINNRIIKNSKTIKLISHSTTLTNINNPIINSSRISNNLHIQTSNTHLYSPPLKVALQTLLSLYSPNKTITL